MLDRALSASDLRAEVAKIAGGPVALVFDGVSTAETQAAGFALLAPGGKLLVLLPDAVKADKDAPETEGRTVVQVHGVVLGLTRSLLSTVGRGKENKVKSLYALRSYPKR